MLRNITPPTAVGVMPYGLCIAFTEELRFEAFVNTYQDGSSDRQPLSINPRHFFRCTRRLTASQYTALWNWFKQYPTDAFYFYNLRETVPPGTWDATGNNTVGRYLVVFDGGWSDEIGLGRSNVSFGLREVA